MLIDGAVGEGRARIESRGKYWRISRVRWRIIRIDRRRKRWIRWVTRRLRNPSSSTRLALVVIGTNSTLRKSPQVGASVHVLVIIEE